MSKIAIPLGLGAIAAGVTYVGGSAYHNSDTGKVGADGFAIVRRLPMDIYALTAIVGVSVTIAVAVWRARKG